MTICSECHHPPSGRYAGEHGATCYCPCHDVADAAPELLAALKAVLAWADCECMPQGGKNDGPWEMIEATITKAKGA